MTTTQFSFGEETRFENVIDETPGTYSAAHNTASTGEDSFFMFMQPQDDVSDDLFAESLEKQLAEKEETIGEEEFRASSPHSLLDIAQQSASVFSSPNARNTPESFISQQVDIARATNAERPTHVAAPSGRVRIGGARSSIVPGSARPRDRERMLPPQLPHWGRDRLQDRLQDTNAIGTNILPSTALSLPFSTSSETNAAAVVTKTISLGNATFPALVQQQEEQEQQPQKEKEKEQQQKEQRTDTPKEKKEKFEIAKNSLALPSEREQQNLRDETIVAKAISDHPRAHGHVPTVQQRLQAFDTRQVYDAMCVVGSLLQRAVDVCIERNMQEKKTSDREKESNRRRRDVDDSAMKKNVSHESNCDAITNQELRSLLSAMRGPLYALVLGNVIDSFFADRSMLGASTLENNIDPIVAIKVLLKVFFGFLGPKIAFLHSKPNENAASPRKTAAKTSERDAAVVAGDDQCNDDSVTCTLDDAFLLDFSAPIVPCEAMPCTDEPLRNLLRTPDAFAFSADAASVFSLSPSAVSSFSATSSSALFSTAAAVEQNKGEDNAKREFTRIGVDSYMRGDATWRRVVDAATNPLIYILRRTSECYGVPASAVYLEIVEMNVRNWHVWHRVTRLSSSQFSTETKKQKELRKVHAEQQERLMRKQMRKQHRFGRKDDYRAAGAPPLSQTSSFSSSSASSAFLVGGTGAIGSGSAGENASRRNDSVPNTVLSAAMTAFDRLTSFSSATETDSTKFNLVAFCEQIQGGLLPWIDYACRLDATRALDISSIVEHFAVSRRYESFRKLSVKMTAFLLRSRPPPSRLSLSSATKAVTTKTSIPVSTSSATSLNDAHVFHMHRAVFRYLWSCETVEPVLTLTEFVTAAEGDSLLLRLLHFIDSRADPLEPFHYLSCLLRAFKRRMLGDALESLRRFMQEEREEQQQQRQQQQQQRQQAKAMRGKEKSSKRSGVDDDGDDGDDNEPISNVVGQRILRWLDLRCALSEKQRDIVDRKTDRIFADLRAAHESNGGEAAQALLRPYATVVERDGHMLMLPLVLRLRRQYRGGELNEVSNADNYLSNTPISRGEKFDNHHHPARERVYYMILYHVVASNAKQTATVLHLNGPFTTLAFKSLTAAINHVLVGKAYSSGPKDLEILVIDDYRYDAEMSDDATLYRSGTPRWVKLETYVREGDEQRFGFFNGVDDFPETIKCRTIPVKERLDALRVDLGEFVAVRHHHVPWRDAADAMRGKVALQHVHVGAFTYYAANCMETLIRDSAIDTDNMTRGDETMARQHIDQMIAERGARAVLQNLVVGTNIADEHERDKFLARRARDLLHAQTLIVDSSTFAVAFQPLEQTDARNESDLKRIAEQNKKRRAEDEERRKHNRAMREAYNADKAKEIRKVHGDLITRTKMIDEALARDAASRLHVSSSLPSSGLVVDGSASGTATAAATTSSTSSLLVSPGDVVATKIDDNKDDNHTDAIEKPEKRAKKGTEKGEGDEKGKEKVEEKRDKHPFFDAIRKKSVVPAVEKINTAPGNDLAKKKPSIVKKSVGLVTNKKIEKTTTASTTKTPTTTTSKIAKKRVRDESHVAEESATEQSVKKPRKQSSRKSSEPIAAETVQTQIAEKKRLSVDVVAKSVKTAASKKKIIHQVKSAQQVKQTEIEREKAVLAACIAEKREIEQKLYEQKQALTKKPQNSLISLLFQRKIDAATKNDAGKRDTTARTTVFTKNDDGKRDAAAEAVVGQVNTDEEEK